jgi:hypothetical protein
MPKSQHNDGLIDLFRNIPSLTVTDLGMVSLAGWDFVLHLTRHDSALPIFIVIALPLQIAGGVVRIGTAFSSKLRDFDELVTAVRQSIVQSGEVPTASPSRA